jgi:hypothetical protein
VRVSCSTCTAPGNVRERVQKLCQHRDFVGLGADRELREHGSGGLAQPGQQVHQVAGRIAGAAQALAIEGDHPPACDRAGAQPHPRPDQLIELVGCEPLQAAADGRLGRDRTGDAEPGQRLRCGVGGPFGDRDERLRTRYHRRQRHRQHPGQAVSNPAPLARVRHARQQLDQPVRRGRNLSQLAQQRVGVVDNNPGGR